MSLLLYYLPLSSWFAEYLVSSQGQITAPGKSVLKPGDKN